MTLMMPTKDRNTAKPADYCTDPDQVM